MSQKSAGLKTISLVPLALAGALLGLAWMQWNNTLRHNGRWTPTKITMGKELIGAQSYWRGRQALAGGRLNLGAWHGYQEVLTARAWEADRFGFDFYLTPDSYVVAMVYEETTEAFTGLRLSLNRRFPNAVLAGTGAGEFLRVRPLSPPMKSGSAQRLELQIDGSRAEASLDGEPLGGLELPGPGPYRVGFRSGWSNAFVDDVVVAGPDGALREGFGPARRIWPLVPALSLLAFGAGLAIFGLVASIGRLPLTTLAANFAMAGSTLLILAGLLWAAAAWINRQPRYPEATPELERQERLTRKRHLTNRRKEVAQAHARERPEGTTRILFLGTSQTWGSGARREDETIPAAVEALLGSTHGDRRFECINGGVSAATAPMLAKVWSRHWIELDPDLLVVDLGNNDQDSVAFRAALERIVDSALEREIRVVLVQEPNSPERPHRGLTANHRVMRQTAESYGVPVVPMHGYLISRIDAGFLWWDKVHLSSFGQRIFAERLIEALSPQLPAIPASRRAG